MLVRAGYAINYNTSVYQTLANQMAQQSPLSKSFSVSNSPTSPLTLADGFEATPVGTPNTFAMNPNFLIGYVQTWNAVIQRDLPGGMIMYVTYLGNKGTRGAQEFYPNTYPEGGANPCPTCPSGYAYLTSNGNSTRESGAFQLRRRLHNGITASVQYTYSKSIDDAILGGKGAGSLVAQNWLDLNAERGLSNFDQRHLATFSAQYTSGMGMHGGTLLSGWRGSAFKGWTLLTNITVGSGLPETPSDSALKVGGASFPGSIRPEYTGASIYGAPAGLFLNPEAYTAALAGEFGDAGRNSKAGPSQFSLSGSLQRSFGKFDFRLDSTNTLNHVVFSSWVTNHRQPTAVRSAGFGFSQYNANSSSDIKVEVLTMRTDIWRPLSIALVCASLLAQQQPQQSSQPPDAKFETTSQLVVLDVNVTDKSGKPIEGLTAKGFHRNRKMACRRQLSSARLRSGWIQRLHRRSRPRRSNRARLILAGPRWILSQVFKLLPNRPETSATGTDACWCSISTWAPCRRPTSCALKAQPSLLYPRICRGPI